MVRAPLPQLLPVVAIPVVGSAKDVYIDALATETANDGVFTFTEVCRAVSKSWPKAHCCKGARPGPSPSQLHLADSRGVDCLAYGLSLRAVLRRYLSPGLSKARFR